MKINLIAKASVWKATTIDRRFHDCRAMLAMHGLLTFAESRKVEQRLDKMRREFQAAREKKKEVE